MTKDRFSWVPASFWNPLVVSVLILGFSALAMPGRVSADSPFFSFKLPNLSFLRAGLTPEKAPVPPFEPNMSEKAAVHSSEQTSPAAKHSSAPVPPGSESPNSADLLPYREVLGQVVCLSVFPLDDMETVRIEIRNLQRDLIDYLGIPESKEKVIMCVFQKRESYVAFLKRNCPQAPSNRPALYVKDNGPGYVFLQLDDHLILNLRHEMTHALLNSTHKNIPIWLDEGLAKYFETPAGERGKSNPFLLPVADRAESFLAPVPSLANLERLKGINEMGAVQYRDSWAWIHFLIHYSPRTQRILSGYLQTLRTENQEGIDDRTAAEIQKTAPLTSLLKSELPGYKKEYRNHFTDWAKR